MRFNGIVIASEATRRSRTCADRAFGRTPVSRRAMTFISGLYVLAAVFLESFWRGRWGQDGEIVSGWSVSSQAISIRHPALTVLSTNGRMGLSPSLQSRARGP